MRDTILPFRSSITYHLSRPGLLFFYIILFVAFVVSFIMVIREYDKFKTGDWYNHRFIPPKWLRSFVNKSGLGYIPNTQSKLILNNTRKCYRRHFDNILLIIGFGALTEYESIPLFELLYKKAFTNRLYCGVSASPYQAEVDFLIIDTRSGAFLYDCLDEAIKTRKNFAGYLFIGEEILLNYWNLNSYNLDFLWEDNNVLAGPRLYVENKDSWEWWESPWGVRAMEKVFEYFTELNYYDNRKAKMTEGEWMPGWDAGQALNKWLWNGDGHFKCFWSNRSIIYIPKKFSDLYLNISKHFRASGVRHSITIPSVTRLITLADKNIKLTSTEINSDNRKKFLKNRTLLQKASEEKDFVYIKGSRKERRAILNDLRMKEYAVGKFLQFRHC